MPGFALYDSNGNLKQTQQVTGYSIISNTDTGAQNNWGPALSGHTIIEWSGASDLTSVTGLSGGVTGQIVIFKNTGTKVAYFAHSSSSSLAANRFTNLITSSTTPVAGGGYIAWVWDGTNWKLIDHTQGAWINVAYSSGDYTASGGVTWTVDSGDVTSAQYLVVGKSVTYSVQLGTTSVSATSTNTLLIKIPNSFSALSTTYGAGHLLYSDAGVGFVGGGIIDVNGALFLTNIRLLKKDISNWTIATNTTGVAGTVTFEVS